MKLTQSTFILIVAIVISIAAAGTQLFDTGILPFSDIVACDNPLETAQVVPKIESFSVTPAALRSGDTATFAWTTKGADQVVISSVPTSQKPNGSVSTQIFSTGKYVLKAYSGNCYVARVIPVEVVTTAFFPWMTPLIIIGVFLVFEALQAAFNTDSVFDSNASNIWAFLGTVRKKLQNKRPWGYVYSSTTKTPLSRVIIRLLDQSGKVVETTVTDINGIFQLNPPKGVYTIKAGKQNYVFPSHVISGDQDGKLKNIYKGEVITIMEDNQPILVSIPLDPQQISAISQIVQKSSTFTALLFNFGATLFLLLGFSISAISILQYRHIAGVGAFLFFGFLILLKIFRHSVKPKTYGKVIEATTRAAIPNIELGAFEAEFNTLVSRVFTDSQGRYSFVVPNQDYYIQPISSEYIIDAEDKKFHVPKHTNDESFITIINDLRLRQNPYNGIS